MLLMTSHSQILCSFGLSQFVPCGDEVFIGHVLVFFHNCVRFGLVVLMGWFLSSSS